MTGGDLLITTTGACILKSESRVLVQERDVRLGTRGVSVAARLELHQTKNVQMSAIASPVAAMSKHKMHVTVAHQAALKCWIKHTL